jgi:hypothetical protein
VKNVSAKSWSLPVANGRRYSLGLPGGAHNVGQVGSYANLNLATYPVYSIDMGVADYATYRSPGNEADTGTSTHHASGWPLGGGAFSRITPPIVNDRGRGILLANLWRDVTLGIQDFNLRWEWRSSSDLASMAGTGPKFLIGHCRDSLADSGADRRPMLFLTPMNEQAANNYSRDNSLAMAPGQGTTQGWGVVDYGDASPPVHFHSDESYQQFYLTNSGDSGTFQGRPLIELGEVVTFELRLITIATTAYPRGLIAFRMYRENGQVFERGIPWNWDANVPLGCYLKEIEEFGAGYWNFVPGGNYFLDVGGYITVARNFGGWLGRRSA